VGGNYDTVFLDTPHASLSFIYKSLGCFHALLPDKDPFVTPSIPALTPEGFVRWQTVELLLGPEEHVPFLQEAVRRFDLVNRGEGGPFPKILPAEALPQAPDQQMCKWHASVSDKLRHDAEVPTFAKANSDFSSAADSSRENNSVNDAADYFQPSRRSYAYAQPVPTSPTTRRAQSTATMSKSNSHSPHHKSRSPHPSSRSPHTTARSPRYTSHRRSSLPDIDPGWDDDDAPHTTYPKTPGIRRPTPPQFQSSSSIASTASSFTVSRSPSPRPRSRNRTYYPPPTLDSTGRRHSAHSPSYSPEKVPVSRSGSSHTLSPPFFASQSQTRPSVTYDSQMYVQPGSGSTAREIRSPPQPQQQFRHQHRHGRHHSYSANEASVRFRGMDEAYYTRDGAADAKVGPRFVGGEGEAAFREERWRRRNMDGPSERIGRR
jgi:hypothetical protein